MTKWNEFWLFEFWVPEWTNSSQTKWFTQEICTYRVITSRQLPQKVYRGYQSLKIRH